MIVTVAAIDPLLLRACPRPERLTAFSIAVVCLANVMFVICAVFEALSFVGKDPPTAGCIAAASGIWFLALQRLLLLFHGENRGRWTAVISRGLCACFLGFFAMVSAVGMTVAESSLFPIEVSAFLCSATFLLPVYARAGLLSDSEYGAKVVRQTEAVLARWNSEFQPRYEALVREQIGDSTYRMPDAMRAKHHRPQSKLAS